MLPLPDIRRIASSAAASVCVATILLMSGCKAEEPPPPAPPPPEVQVAPPQMRDVTDYLEYTGNTEALAQVDLRARVPGYLEKINFTEGKPVKKGDLLFVIEKAPFEAAVARAEADVVARKASLAGAEADAILAAELADQRAGPEIDRVVKAARRDSAKAAVAESEAILQNARLNLGYCEVFAPVDGVISRTYVDAGNLVGQGESTRLATIVASKPIYVTVAVSESDMLRARRAQVAYEAANGPVKRELTEFKAFLALADDGNFNIEGTLDYVDPAVDRQTGTIGVRMVFANENEFLIPGMFVRARIPLDTRSRMVIPQTAISQDQAGFFVLAVGPDGTVVRKRIAVGGTDGADRVVLEGLSAGDSVIVQGAQRARVGGKVSARQAAATASPPATAQPSLKHGATRENQSK
jgi:RND family efflux transporter MFP subunit